MKKFYPLIVILIFYGHMIAQDQNTENKLRLAQSYEQIGQTNKAEEIYRELYNSQPVNYQYFDLLNKSLISQKKYDESVKLIESRIPLSPSDYNLYGMLGSTYYIMDQTQQAFEIWEKGISINPKSNISYRVIANYAIENRAYDKAIEILKRGKNISGDPLIFSMDLANIYAANMKFENAAEEFCNLIDYHPEQAQVVKARMNSYLNRPGAAEETITAIKKFLESKPKLELYDLLVFAYQANDDFKNAYDNVIAMEKRFGNNGTYVFIYAQDAFRNKEYNWASDAYNFIVKNYSVSPYYQLAKIGYARTLETSLDQKFNEYVDSWKPVKKRVPLFIENYLKIVTTYNEFVKGFNESSINAEALLRMAEIYRTRIFDFQKADSLYNLLAQSFPNTNYYIQANLAKGKIAIEKNDLDNAKLFFQNVKNFQRSEPNQKAEADFFIARIEFWNGNFSQSMNIFNQAAKNHSADFANDAIEFASIITITKKDSVNLFHFAKADLFLIQNKIKQALIEFKTLSDNPNLFIINEFSKLKLAEIFILEDDFLSANNFLEDLLKNENNSIFAEKAIFLLANCYQYGIKDLRKAAQIYQKLLETFPNSLYFDRAREALNGISTKNG